MSSMIANPGHQWGGNQSHPDINARHLWMKYSIGKMEEIAYFITPGGQAVTVRVSVYETSKRIHYNLGGEH
jgi:hypothetical protein